jgi:hypothetical protein
MSVTRISVFLGRIDWSDLVTQVVATLLAAGIIFLLTLCWNQRRKSSGLEEKLRTCEDEYSKVRNRAEKAEGEAGGLQTTNALYEQELQRYRDAEAGDPPIPGAHVGL